MNLAGSIDVGGGIIVYTAVLVWLACALATFAAALIAGIFGSKAAAIAGIALMVTWCADQAVTLAFDWTSPVPVTLALDAVPFVWFVTREDYGSRLFALTFAAMLPIHLNELVALEPDPWAYWWRWTRADFAQLGWLVGWAVVSACLRRRDVIASRNALPPIIRNDANTVGDQRACRTAGGAQRWATGPENRAICKDRGSTPPPAAITGK